MARLHRCVLFYSVTSKWIAAGATFPADLSSENLTKLKKVVGLHPLLMESAKRNIKRWFPVQNAVLPSLLKDTNFPPVLPPRFDQSTFVQCFVNFFEKLVFVNYLL